MRKTVACALCLVLLSIFGLIMSGCAGSTETPLVPTVLREAAATPDTVPTTNLSIVLTQVSKTAPPPGSLRAALTPTVTCTLTLLQPGVANGTSQTRTQTVDVIGGQASLVFNELPILPAIGEIQINGGRLGADSSFHGACDLSLAQTNTLVVAPVGSRAKPDLLATVGKRVLTDPALLGQAPSAFFTTIEQAISTVATDSATVYDTAFAKFAALIPPDPTYVWGSSFPDGLIDSNKNTIGFPTLKNKIIGLYFSASWCPYCSEFTPNLLTFRNTNAGEFEVIHIPFDSTEASQLAYMKNAGMPCPTVPFTSSAVAALKQLFNVTGIPKLIILSARGTFLTANGRSDVTNAPLTCLQSWKNAALATP